MRWWIPISFGLALVGCDEMVVFSGGEPRPNVRQSKDYRKDKLRFSYPGNWIQSEEEEETGGVKIRTTWVKSKGNALALVQTFIPAVPVDLDQYAREFLGGMRQEFKDNWKGMIRAKNVKTGSFADLFIGKKRKARRIQFMLKALGFPQPMVVEIRQAKLADGTVVMGTMVPRKYSERVRVGFDRIRDSVRFGKE